MIISLWIYYMSIWGNLIVPALANYLDHRKLSFDERRRTNQLEMHQILALKGIILRISILMKKTINDIMLPVVTYTMSSFPWLVPLTSPLREDGTSCKILHPYLLSRSIKRFHFLELPQDEGKVFEVAQLLTIILWTSLVSIWALMYT